MVAFPWIALATGMCFCERNSHFLNVIFDIGIRVAIRVIMKRSKRNICIVILELIFDKAVYVQAPIVFPKNNMCVVLPFSLKSPSKHCILSDSRVIGYSPRKALTMSSFGAICFQSVHNYKKCRWALWNKPNILLEVILLSSILQKQEW